MKKIFYFLPLLALIAFSFYGCSDGPVANNNLEQIYREEGVPVRTVSVTPRPFETWLLYNAELEGIKESSGDSMVADRVDKIYVRVGDYVQKDQVILSFPTDNPAAQYHQAKVAYESAKKSYERIKNLYSSGGVSRQDLDNAKAAYDVASANWNSARQSIEVKAPISGYITKMNVSESDNVHPGDELFTVSQTNRLRAKVWATEKEILDIRVGQAATAEWNGVKLDGSVTQVDMALNHDMQAFGVVIEFNNPENKIPLGVTAEVHIMTYSTPDAVVVERKNVFRDKDGLFVYVAADGKAVRRTVAEGREQGPDVEITGGLNPGDELIVEGQILLEDGTKIKRM